MRAKTGKGLSKAEQLAYKPKAKRKKTPKHVKRKRKWAKFKATIPENTICEWCGEKNACHAHHIKFKSQGGTDERGNVALICFDCHNEAHGIKKGSSLL